MQKQEQSTLFAFKLADKQQDAKPAQPWKVREGVSVAGCTDPIPDSGWYRFTNRTVDDGAYC